MEMSNSVNLMIEYEIRCDTTMSMHTLKVLVKESSAEVKIVSSLTEWYNAIRLCNNREERLQVLQVYNLIESKVQDGGNCQFNVDHSSWRASIHQYQKGKTRYAHYRQTDYLLAESGWHCSFCF
ncbi:putative glycosyl transferase, family 17 [Helianthus annuus]|nr:putative glycosyl transferase, family 17 [Helianthus annuus]